MTQCLITENDTDKISEMIVQILEENQDVVDRIKTGEDKLVGFLVGLYQKNQLKKLHSLVM